MADTILIRPDIYADTTYDQMKAKSFEFVVSRNDGGQYFAPYEIMMRWTAKIEDAQGKVTHQTKDTTFSNLSSTVYPPWVQITIPANLFPTPPRGCSIWFDFIATCRYVVPGGNGVNSYYSPVVWGVSPPIIELEGYAEGDYINDRATVPFLWRVYYNRNSTTGQWGDEEDVYQQVSAVFQWRDGASGSVRTVNHSGKVQSLTIAANTFPPTTAQLQYRVKALLNDGTDTDFSAWRTLTTVDSKSNARILSPRGEYLTGNEPHPFSWEHTISTGTEQTKAELRYSADAGGNWTVFQTVAEAAKSVVIPAGTLPGANLLWQVRTYNSDNIAGNWSDPAPIVIYAAPRSPGLLPVDAVSRPLIRWQSVEQQAFEVRAGEWRSGAVFGTAKQYQVPIWLPDGTVALGVRVQSALGLWSEWANITSIIRNVPPGPLLLTARGVDNGVRLTWRGVFERYLIYRDGKIEGETTGLEWVDWMANGRSRYQVRGVTGEAYALSNEVIEITSCPYGVLSAADDIHWIALRGRRGSRPGHAVESARQTTLRYFSGRSLPVAEVAEAVERVHTLDYTLRREERGLVLEIRGLIGKTVLYKDPQGACVIGLLQSVAEQCDGAVDITLSIVETDGGTRYGA